MSKVKIELKYSSIHFDRLQPTDVFEIVGYDKVHCPGPYMKVYGPNSESWCVNLKSGYTFSWKSSGFSELESTRVRPLSVKLVDDN